MSTVVKDELSESSYVSQAFVDTSHSFFYEHEVDHIPGLFIIEFARQSVIASTHLFYDVSHENIFVMNVLNTSFFKVAENNLPLYYAFDYINIDKRKGKLIGFEIDGSFIQNGSSIGEINGEIKIIPKNIYHRMRQQNKVSL